LRLLGVADEVLGPVVLASARQVAPLMERLASVRWMALQVWKKERERTKERMTYGDASSVGLVAGGAPVEAAAAAGALHLLAAAGNPVNGAASGAANAEGAGQLVGKSPEVVGHFPEVLWLEVDGAEIHGVDLVRQLIGKRLEVLEVDPVVVDVERLVALLLHVLVNLNVAANIHGQRGDGGGQGEHGDDVEELHVGGGVVVRW
jgi:hypothetical protein